MQDGHPLHAFNFKHIPVLSQDILASLDEVPKNLLEEGLMIDATIGGGGHAALVLKKYPKLQIIGIDQDPNARKAASKNLCKYEKRVKIIDKNFADFIPEKKVIMVLADLGVSSHQLEEASRGFSFKTDGPIDMRMNPNQITKASDLIIQLNEKELADMIYQYGEERLSRKIAHRIKTDLSEKGPYSSTKDLAFAISGCYPPKLRYSRIHPATRTFQALRIAVNNELEVLDKLLEKAPDWLHSSGIFCIISFHSLEDRKVKQAFSSDGRLIRVTKKPIQANTEEVLNNPRSRSAKLRIAKRL